jgi:hypothetical protein
MSETPTVKTAMRAVVAVWWALDVLGCTPGFQKRPTVGTRSAPWVYPGKAKDAAACAAHFTTGSEAVMFEFVGLRRSEAAPYASSLCPPPLPLFKPPPELLVRGLLWCPSQCQG